jgi:nucleoside-diphosphate-sugar epimerase
MGYIGCVLSDHLANLGYDVEVVDLCLFGQDAYVQLDRRVTVHTTDMRHLDTAFLSRFDVVANLAGISSDPQSRLAPKACWELNYRAAVTLALRSREAGVGKYLFASTCSIYDGLKPQGGLADETSRVRPAGPYSRSKLAAEFAIRRLAGPGFASAVLRKGTVMGYSKRNRFDLVVNAFVKDALTDRPARIIGGGTAWRPIVDVVDVARAYTRLIEVPPLMVSNQVYNLCLENRQVLEIAHATGLGLAQRGVNLKLIDDLPNGVMRNYRASGRKFARELGWAPRVTIPESVTQLVDQLRSEGAVDFDAPRYYNEKYLASHSALGA